MGLKEIASDLGVSISLVSKVLSGNLGTSGATAERIAIIEERARQVGYRKNLLAHALRTGRQNAIAVYVHRHGLAGTSIVDEMMTGIAEEATRLHQRLVIHYYETADEFRAFQPRVYANAVDGVLIGGIPHVELASELADMQSQGLPIITILDEPLSDQFPNVGLNQTELCRRSTLHLIDQGCRRLAHIRCRSDGKTFQAHQRFQGFLVAMKERNLPVDANLVIEVPDYDYRSGHFAAERLLGLKIPFDGVVGQSDQHAVGFLNEVTRLGINVPGQIKIVGVDNSPFCLFTYVPLSSVSQEFRKRGTAAVQMMMESLTGVTPLSIDIDPVVTGRTSSGC